MDAAPDLAGAAHKRSPKANPNEIVMVARSAAGSRSVKGRKPPMRVRGVPSA
jgi:hypothetical protein